MYLRTQLVSGQRLAATLPYAVRTFLQCLVSQIAPAVVWRASQRDYRTSQSRYMDMPKLSLQLGAV